jgi:hypothetical protein
MEPSYKAHSLATGKHLVVHDSMHFISHSSETCGRNLVGKQEVIAGHLS